MDGGESRWASQRKQGWGKVNKLGVKIINKKTYSRKFTEKQM